MPSSHAPLVLSLLWLQKHNPVIDWVMGRVVNWSSFCHSSCLKSAQSPCALKNCVAPPEPPDISSVPSVYHDLAKVFSKHCAIDLLPGASFPTSQLYNHSAQEREAMEKYITESLNSGIIRPSSSRLGAIFFFVAKKDKTLRSCIDFCGLNNITVKKTSIPCLL